MDTDIMMNNIDTRSYCALPFHGGMGSASRHSCADLPRLAHMLLRLAVGLAALLGALVTSSTGRLLSATLMLEVTWDLDEAPEVVRDLRETSILTCNITIISSHALSLTCSAAGQIDKRTAVCLSSSCFVS